MILGARGRLGGALAASAEFGRVVALDRSVYSSWARQGAATDVSAYFDKLAVPADRTRILIASGVTDPAIPRDEHHRVNYMLPRNVIEGARRRGLKVVTFGSILELIASRQSQNPYVVSKIRLAEFIRQSRAADAGVLHIRLHTLYGGGPPANFMFLGQIRDAIAGGTRFDMSEGTQLREYHHVDDEVRAIPPLLRSGVSGTIELSHGEPLRLRDLAAHIFTAFGCLDKLNIGAKPMAEHENLGTVFPRPHLLEGIKFRDTRAAVVDYLKAYIYR